MSTPALPPDTPPASAPYSYAIIRIVPHEARGEFINAGVILYSAARKFLSARVSFEPERLRALAPGMDLATAEKHLAAIPKICAGGAEAGELAGLSLAERFRWLTSPRNTLIQTSPVHTGITGDLEKTLGHLLQTLVLIS